MAKITMTADEEFMYLHQLDKIRELIPELEIQVLSQSMRLQIVGNSDHNMGGEFKKFMGTPAESSKRAIHSSSIS